MPILINSYKKLHDDESIPEYANEYVISDVGAADSDAVRDIMHSIVAAERIIHLPHVEFTRITAQPYTPAGGAQIVPTAGVVPCRGGRGLREDNSGEPCPWHYHLYVRKQVSEGQHGRLMYRGCLTWGNISQEVDDRWTLQDIAAWDNSFYTWFMYHFQNVLPYLRVPVNAGASRNPTGFKFVSKLFITGVSLHNGVKRSKVNIKPRSQQKYDEQAALALSLAELYQDIEYWAGLETDFNPPTLLDRSVAAIGACKTTSESLAEYLKDADGNSNTGEVPPVVRFGDDADALLSLCQTCAGLTDTDLEIMQQLQAYTFLDGERYIDLDTLNQCKDMMKKYRGYAGTWGEFDWLNPNAYVEPSSL